MKRVFGLLLAIAVIFNGLSSFAFAGIDLHESRSKESCSFSVKVTAMAADQSVVKSQVESEDDCDTGCHDCPVHCRSHCHSGNFVAVVGLASSFVFVAQVHISEFVEELLPLFSPSNLYRPPIA